MVITEDDRIAERIKILALHGMSKDAWRRFSDEGYKHYQVIHAGYKYNMIDMQAAIGIHQLPRIDQYRQKRRDIWCKYNDAFQDLPCQCLWNRTRKPNTPIIYIRHCWKLKNCQSQRLGIKCPNGRKYRHRGTLSAGSPASLLSQNLWMEEK